MERSQEFLTGFGSGGFKFFANLSRIQIPAYDFAPPLSVLDYSLSLTVSARSCHISPDLLSISSSRRVESCTQLHSKFSKYLTLGDFLTCKACDVPCTVWPCTSGPSAVCGVVDVHMYLPWHRTRRSGTIPNWLTSTSN